MRGQLHRTDKETCLVAGDRIHEGCNGFVKEGQDARHVDHESPSESLDIVMLQDI